VPTSTTPGADPVTDSGLEVTVPRGVLLDLGANIAGTWSIVRGDHAVGRLRALGLPARLVSVDGAVTTVAGWPPDDRP
jgi:hypothetical protein